MSQAHDNRLCPELLTGLQPQSMLLAGRGYDADGIRALVNQQGERANIPPKRNRKESICFSPPSASGCELMSPRPNPPLIVCCD